MSIFVAPSSFCPSLTLSLCLPEEILERFRAKKEEELQEVKRRAAEEAQKALLEKGRKEGDVEKEDVDAKLNDEGQPEGKIEALAKEEEDSKDEGTEEINNGVKTEGDWNICLVKVLLILTHLLCSTRLQIRMWNIDFPKLPTFVSPPPQNKRTSALLCTSLLMEKLV